MKKYIISAIVFLSLGFAFPSCTNPDVSFTKNVSVTVSPYHVLADITEYFSGAEGHKGKETYIDDELGAAKLKICVFVYKQDGLLFNNYEIVLDNYNEDATFNLSGCNNDESYTVIALSYATFASTSNYDPYSVSGSSTIAGLSVLQNVCSTLYSNYALLGIGKSTINPQNSSSINITMKPASALVALQYHYLHSQDSKNIDTYQFWIHNNDIMYYSGSGDEFSYKSSAEVNVGLAMKTKVEDFSGDNVYYLCYFMPAKNYNFEGSYFIGTSGKVFDNGTYTFKSGNLYCFEIDCKNLNIKLNQLTKSDFSPYQNNELMLGPSLLKVSDVSKSVKVIDMLNY